MISKIWGIFKIFKTIYIWRCATCLLPTRSSQRGDFGTFSTCPLLVSLPSRLVAHFHFQFHFQFFKIRWRLLWSLYCEHCQNSRTISTFRCSNVVYHDHDNLPFPHCTMSTFVKYFHRVCFLKICIFPSTFAISLPLFTAFLMPLLSVKSKTSSYSQMQGILGPPTVYYYIQVTEQMLMDQPAETLVRSPDLFIREGFRKK